MLDVVVTGPANQPPTVTSITGATTIIEGASGTLTGMADDVDGTISSHSWEVNNPAVMIDSGASRILQYTASQVSSDTPVIFTLTVTDNDGGHRLSHLRRHRAGRPAAAGHVYGLHCAAGLLPDQPGSHV